MAIEIAIEIEIGFAFGGDLGASAFRSGSSGHEPSPVTRSGYSCVSKARTVERWSVV